MTDLGGRSVLVAGASGGLGAPISRLLAEAGAQLTLVARDEQRLAGIGVDAESVAVDLGRAGMAARAVEAAVAAHGRLDGVVYAAGAVAFGPASEACDEVLIELFTVNTLAPMRLLRAAHPYLEASAQDGGKPFVVHLSGLVADKPLPGMAAYSASKAALAAFDAAAARELRRVGVRLIDARPPHTETGLAERPLAGTAPRLPAGLAPDVVASRILSAIQADEKDLPSAAFG